MQNISHLLSCTVQYGQILYSFLMLALLKQTLLGKNHIKEIQIIFKTMKQ